jgi:transcriptional regulator
VGDQNLNLIRGTVDMLILKALSWEPKHGYAVSEWIQSVTDGTLLIEEGTLYPALHRLESKGLIDAEWGLSENNRKAKFYGLTPEGRARLDREQSTWSQYSHAVEKAMAEETSRS